MTTVKKETAVNVSGTMDLNKNANSYFKGVGGQLAKDASDLGIYRTVGAEYIGGKLIDVPTALCLCNVGKFGRKIRE